MSQTEIRRAAETGDACAATAHGALLSERETQILQMACRERTNADIARTLHISANTLKSHIRSAYRKLGVRSRAEAIRWMTAHGLVDDN